jgi:colicin import membrane protein
MSSLAYTIPAEPGRWGAFTLAGLVHLVLIAFLWIGIRWQNETPVTVEAEVWDTSVRQAAPKPVEPPPPEPKVVKVEPKIEPEPVKAPPPDIVLEKKKEPKHKVKKETKPEPTPTPKPTPVPKATPTPVPVDQKALDKKARAEKARAEQASLDKLRDERMAQITGATGAATATGDAPRSTGPRGDPGYGSAIKAKIDSNKSYIGDTNVPGNPRVSFKVTQLPTGEVIGIRMIKSSGIPAFDTAMENAINKSSPLPRKKDGSVDREIELEFNLKQ